MYEDGFKVLKTAHRTLVSSMVVVNVREFKECVICHRIL